MCASLLKLFFVCYIVNNVCGSDQVEYIDDADISTMSSIYYDPKSRLPFRIASIENSLINKVQSNGGGGQWPQHPYATKTHGIQRKIAYRSNGCTCQQLTCGCCLGLNLNQFNFNREGCMNFTYDPQEFAINMDMVMNEMSVYSNSVSAKYPPPLCIPIPIPYLPLSVEGCARLFDVYTPGQNLHMCFDFETRIQQATVLILHFDCMRMGNDGVAFVKPGDNGGLTIPTTVSSQVDSEIYNEVTEIKGNQNKFKTNLMT